jgi:hypothetical protein
MTKHNHGHHHDDDPVPTQQGQIDFNVTAVDQSGALITKPLVIRIDAGLSGTVRATNPANFYHGPPKTPAWIGDVEVIADGYAPWTTGANPQVTFDGQTVNVVATLVPASFRRPPAIARGPLPPFVAPYSYPYIPGMDVLPWPENAAASVSDEVPDALSRNPSRRLEHWRHVGRLEAGQATIVQPLSATPSFAPRTRDYLRADSWGVEMPGAPVIDRGVSSRHPERILSWFIDRYPLDFQQQYLEKVVGYGYTHLRLSYGDSTAAKDQPSNKPPGAGQTLDQLIETCLRVKKYGLYVRMMLGSKYFQPNFMDTQQWAAFADPIMDAMIAAKCVDEFTLGWEWNLWNHPGPVTIDSFRHMGQKAHAAGCSAWMHFSAHVTSWFADGDPRGRFGFYDDLHNDVDGIDYQTDPSWSMEETQARLVDTLWQFGQRGNDYKMRFDEDMATLMWDNDRPNPEDANARGYLACCTIDNVKWTNARIWGFGNGARMPDGSPL